jgi:hypothetical protein
MNRFKQNCYNPNQTELFAVVWFKPEQPFRLRVNDLFRTDGRLCRVIRVNECCAVVLMNKPERVFSTRFDKPVKFRQPPALFQISPNSEVQILNRKSL